MYETNPNVLLTLRRYTQNAERSYDGAFSELAAAMRVQNEANFINGLAQADVMSRLIEAPCPAILPSARNPPLPGTAQSASGKEKRFEPPSAPAYPAASLINRSSGR